jgi:hypothetical protein
VLKLRLGIVGERRQRWIDWPSPARFAREQARSVLLHFLGHVIRNRSAESRPQEVKQQHTARELGIIPSFMLGGVVEDQALPLLPGPRRSGHP